MKSSMRYCKPCNKTLKHTIIEEDIKYTLKKETRTCSQCKITLSRVVGAYDKDKIILICYKCKEETSHGKMPFGHHYCTICGEYKR